MAVKWTKEQEQVINLRGRNLLVSAAAGSGKTAVLVQRILSKVMDPEHPVDIDRLLIVTFTNAAAAEMRERIAAGITARLEADPGNEHIQKQSALLHNAQITTIDSFSLFLIRNHFNEIGLDPDFRVADIDYDDPDTYTMLARGETEGIFQLESTGMTQVLTGMRPKNLEDIIALISLYRPGPMDSIPTYLRNRKDPSKVSYKTPQMAHIVDVTNGVVIYQEQVMQICRELAGFSFGQADNVRRAMSKKKLKVMEAEREHFVHGCKEPGKECAGCVANGVPENVANQIYDDMISFASYAFNKSHAACYAYVAFQTAYLKCHYPHEFMAALLTSVLDNTSKVIEYTTECQRLGIKVQQPDINISRGGFTADGDLIRFGLNAVKSVGRGLIDAVIKERAQRPYRSLYDFCKRLHGSELNRRALENLIKAGAFDALEPTRRGMLESVEGILKSVETDARQNLDGQMDLFGLMSGGNEKPADDYKVPALP